MKKVSICSKLNINWDLIVLMALFIASVVMAIYGSSWLSTEASTQEVAVKAVEAPAVGYGHGKFYEQEAMAKVGEGPSQFS